MSIWAVKQIRSAVQWFLTPYCGADQDELFFPGSPHTTVLHWGGGAGIYPDLIPTWNLNRGPGKCSIYSIQEWGSVDVHVMKPSLPKGFRERQPGWSQLQVIFHKSNDLTSLVLRFINPFENPTLFWTVDMKGIYYQRFQVQLTWLNSRHYILSKLKQISAQTAIINELINTESDEWYCWLTALHF